MTQKSLDLVFSYLKKEAEIANINQNDDYHSRATISDGKIWLNAFSLFKKKLMTQTNLYKISRHADKLNLLKIIDIFSPPKEANKYKLITPDFIDKLCSQRDLARLKYRIAQIPDHIWGNNERLANTLEKLMSRNNKLVAQKISATHEKQRDTTIEPINLDKILANYTSAPTALATAETFNRSEASISYVLDTPKA